MDSGMWGKRQEWGEEHFPSSPFACPGLLFVGMGEGWGAECVCTLYTLQGISSQSRDSLPTLSLTALVPGDPPSLLIFRTPLIREPRKQGMKR